MESYKHQYAKRVLAEWLRADPGLVECSPNREHSPLRGVFEEYPICLNSNNTLTGVAPVWDECGDVDHLGAPEVPTYEACIAGGLLPVVVFDVAVLHKGDIGCAIEVVHRHGLTDDKRKYLDRMWLETSQPHRLYVVDADWILQQVKPPEKLRFTEQYYFRG